MDVKCMKRCATCAAGSVTAMHPRTPTTNTRASVCALVRDWQGCRHRQAPGLGRLVPALVMNLELRPAPVFNNASWAIGEMATVVVQPTIAAELVLAVPYLLRALDPRGQCSRHLVIRALNLVSSTVAFDDTHDRVRSEGLGGQMRKKLALLQGPLVLWCEMSPCSRSAGSKWACGLGG